MKHKKIKMIISFLLALVLLVSLPLDIQANAVALEGWAIYALISYLAAMGITFTVSGGVDALLKAVQEKTDEYIKVTGIDLLGIIHQSVTIRGGGNGGGWWFGFAAAAAVMEFIQWVRENGWANGDTVEETITDSFVYSNTGDIVYLTPTQGTGTTWRTYERLGTVYSFSEALSLKNSDGISNLGIGFIGNDRGTYKGQEFYFFASSSYTNGALDWNRYFKIYTSTTGSGSKFDAHSKYTAKGYTFDDILGYTFVDKFGGSQTAVALAIIFPNNEIMLTELVQTDIYDTVSNATITTPEEFPDVTPSEDEGVLIDTGGDISTLTTPEEMAENIKQIFDDTGTITKPTVTVKKDPTITPTPPPELTPEPSPEIEDIEDLGLPALGEAIKNKFPFCLPSDLRDLISLLVAEPVTPKWEVDLYEWFDGALAGDTTFGIDLAEYEVLGQISRWASVISFSIFLLLITKGMIGW